jgi:hypothetical protein
MPAPAAAARLSAFPWAILAVALALVIVTYPVFDCDLYWHLANGRAMLKQGRIVNEELFSFTHRGTPFVNHEWLGQIALFSVWDRYGANGLLALKWAISAAAIAVLFHTTRGAGAGNRTAALLCAFTALAGIRRFQVRPELFTLLGMAILGLALDAHRRGGDHRGRLWTIPIMMLVWDWLHGAVLGLAYFSVVVAAEGAKRLVPAWRAGAMDGRRLASLGGWYAFTLAIMLANPYGPRSYGHFLVLAGGLRGADRIGELQPIWSAPADWLPLLFLLLWALTLLVVDRWEFDLTEWALFAAFALGALRYNRLAAVAAIALVPIIARHAAPPAGAAQPRWRTNLGAALIAAGCAIVVCVGAWEKFGRMSGGTAGDGTYTLPSPTAFGVGLNEALVPAGSARFAGALGLSGHMYNNANLGGYLAYALAPERPIFQYNLPPVFGDPTRFVRDPDALAAWDIDYGFAGSVGELTRLFPQDAWAWVYSDYVSTLVVRRAPEHAELIARYELRYFAPEQSAERFRALAACEAVRPRLAFEMAVYLAYSRDERTGGRLRELLAKDPELGAGGELDDLLRLVWARNPN